MNVNMKSGLLYFAQNPAFPHLTKIGQTTQLNVVDRGLSTSNVPDDFIYLCVLKCDDVDWAEKKVHEQFKEFRHKPKGDERKTTEFFWSGCIENAIKYAKDLKGVYDNTDEETEDSSKRPIEIIDPDPSINDFVSWEDIRMMMPNDSPFKNEKNAKEGWIKATNYYRMNTVKMAKKLGKWKDTKISLSWLKESGKLAEIMEIKWDYSK